MTTRTRTGLRPCHAPIRLLLAAAVLVAALPSPPAQATDLMQLAAPSSCPLPVAPDAAFAPRPIVSFEPTPANGSVPACPAPRSCPGNPSGWCTTSDLGPCCTSGGATLCCPAGTTLQVDQCLYSWVSGVVARGWCFDLQLTCG